MDPTELVVVEAAEPARDDRSMKLLELGLAILAFASVALLTIMR